MPQSATATSVQLEITQYIKAECERYGTTKAVRPGHRSPFQWPPPNVTLDYHITGAQFTETATIEIDNEEFTAQIAETPHGFFGRIEHLWNEARADSIDELIDKLKSQAWPLIFRQKQIAILLGKKQRFTQSIESLEPADRLKLLFAPDRDIAHEAMIAIDQSASSHVYGPALLVILKDRTHPYRRSAQWVVLDLFEDLPSYCQGDQEQEAIQAIKDLIWDAEDDFARTTYKAGVVLGGHICTEAAAKALLDCFHCPSKIGRRSAYHASFHLAEWCPERREHIAELLQKAANEDPEPILREYCAAMARDVANADPDHVADPFFPEENN